MLSKTSPALAPIFLLLLLVGSASPALAAPSGLLQGTVTADGTGAALADIEVSAYEAVGADWRYVAFANTDATGGYQLPLEDGDYRVLFRDWSGDYAFEYFPDAATLDAASDVTVAGATTLDASLATAGRIAGTVADPVGGDLDNVLIAVYDTREELLFVQQPAGTTYDVGGLPSGDFVVRFTASQGSRSYLEFYAGASDFAGATPVAVTAGSTTSGIDAALGLEPGGTIRGFVRDPYGRAFDVATVTALEDQGGTWVEVASTEVFYLDDDFDYALDVPPGTYRLRFEGASFFADQVGRAVELFDDALTVQTAQDVTVAFDELVTGLDARVGDLATGTLSGTVTDGSGSPLAGVEVLLATRRGGVLTDQIAVTDGSGDYTVQGLWPESYTVRFYDPQGRAGSLYFGGSVGPTGAQRVPVGDGVTALSTVTGVDISLTAPPPNSGSLSGTLTDGSGASLGGVSVTALRSPCDYSLGFADCEFVTSTTSAGDGTYRLRDLAPGDYLLRFRGKSQPFAVGIVQEFYDDQAELIDATPVAVAAGADTAGLDATLEVAGSIAGTVTDPFGGGFSLLSASAYRFEGGEWVFVASDTELNGSHYRIDGLAPGTYRVAFTGGGFSPFQQDSEVYDDAPTLDLGTDVQVTAGAVTAGIDAVLGDPPPGAITGTVTDGAGDPVAGAEVTVEDANGFEVAAVTTLGDGTYAAAPLFDGFYYVRFEDPAGVLPGEYYLDVADRDRATPVTVAGAATVGVDAVLDGANSTLGGGVIRGQVVSATDGQLLAGIRVSCRPLQDDWIGFSLPCSGVTAADGTYEIGGTLPTGDYRVDFSSSNGAWAAETYDAQLFSGDATPVAVTVGAATTGIDASLEPGAGLAGTVTDVGGNAYGLLYVSVFSRAQPADPWRFVRGDFYLNESDYRFEGLRPGTYRVAFRGSSVASILHPDEEVWDDAATLDEGDDVVLVGGQTTVGIDAVLGDLPEQVVTNAGFDEGLDGWLTAPGPTSEVAFSDRDVHGDDASGSARLRHNGLESLSALSRCSAVAPGTYRLSAWVEVDSDLAEDPRTVLLAELFADGDCDGAPLDDATVVAETGGDTAGWLRLAGAVTVPAEAAAVRLSVAFEAGAAADFTAHVDEVLLRADGALFADGFESGGLGAWTLAAGE